MSNALRAAGLALLWLALVAAKPASNIERIGFEPQPEPKFIPYLGTAGFPDLEDPTRFTAGAAFRLPMTSWLDADIGLCYRNTRAFNGALHVSQLPVTASLWLMPISPFYFGGGGGWYRMSQVYETYVGTEYVRYSDTSGSFGGHVGAGLLVRLQDDMLIDLQGRYSSVESANPLEQFVGELDPSSWSVTLGLAFELSGY